MSGLRDGRADKQAVGKADCEEKEKQFFFWDRNKLIKIVFFFSTIFALITRLEVMGGAGSKGVRV